MFERAKNAINAKNARNAKNAKSANARGAKGDKVRRDVRWEALGLVTSIRSLGDAGPWSASDLHDLSVGGALLRFPSQPALGERFELQLARAKDSLSIVVRIEVVRLVARADGPAAGVRFLELKGDVAKKIAAVLSEAHVAAASEETLTEASVSQVVDAFQSIANGHDPGDDIPDADVDVDVDEVVPALSTLRLHDVSLYDLLELEPTCDDGALESKCEELIADVGRQMQAAVGRREERLRILHTSLERMRPLWSDPIKRARYDLRWGYVQAEERFLAAARGTGVHPHVLAGIWFDLYPESVRTANRIIQAATAMANPSDADMIAALRQALELDPFCRRKRQLLASLENPDSQPDKSPVIAEAQTMRGNLADLPVSTLLRTMAEDSEDVEIVVRSGGKAIGVVGFTGGDVVTAICGEARGLAALKLLAAVREGTFQARYASPREHLRHMCEPAQALLEQVVSLQ